MNWKRAQLTTTTPGIVVVLTGVLAVVLASLLDDVFQPALIWGGDLCRDTSSIVATCGVPPVGLVVSIGAAAVVVVGSFQLISRRWDGDTDDE